VYRRATLAAQQANFRTLALRDRIPGKIVSPYLDAPLASTFIDAYPEFTRSVVSLCIELSAALQTSMRTFAVNEYSFIPKVREALNAHEDMQLDADGERALATVGLLFSARVQAQPVVQTDRSVPNHFVDLYALPDEQIDTVLRTCNGEVREALKRKDPAVYDITRFSSEEDAMDYLREHQDELRSRFVAGDWETLSGKVDHAHNRADIVYRHTLSCSDTLWARQQYDVCHQIDPEEQPTLTEILRVARLEHRYVQENPKLRGLSAQMLANRLRVNVPIHGLQTTTSLLNTYGSVIVDEAKREIRRFDPRA
jgi:hypothetical protein